MDALILSGWFPDSSLIQGVHCAGLSDVHGASQYVMPHGGIFLGKWPSAFAGSCHGKINVQSLRSEHPIYVLVVFSYLSPNVSFIICCISLEASYNDGCQNSTVKRMKKGMW
jgi:hypothetical protein